MWILLIATTYGAAVQPLVWPETFRTQAECKAKAEYIKGISADAKLYPYLNGICIPKEATSCSNIDVVVDMSARGFHFLTYGSDVTLRSTSFLEIVRFVSASSGMDVNFGGGIGPSRDIPKPTMNCSWIAEGRPGP